MYYYFPTKNNNKFYLYIHIYYISIQKASNCWKIKKNVFKRFQINILLLIFAGSLLFLNCHCYHQITFTLRHSTIYPHFESIFIWSFNIFRVLLLHDGGKLVFFFSSRLFVILFWFMLFHHFDHNGFHIENQWIATTTTAKRKK